MKSLVKKLIGNLGYELIRKDPQRDVLAAIPDLPPNQQNSIKLAAPFSMTSTERMAALVQAVSHISTKGIPGDIAECGVWRGGSMMSAALTLISLGDTSRNIYLYDTYEGMPPPTDDDKSYAGMLAADELKAEPKGTGIWCYASLEDVKANLLSTGYPEDRIHVIKGKVEDTIPARMPGPLALLRLDTDWYESTKHELTHLFPLLHERGILMIDDYGHWQRARNAVDEYFAEANVSGYLHRVDYTGRIMVRCGK